MSTSRSKRPKRRRAASIEFGLFVAAITITCARWKWYFISIIMKNKIWIWKENFKGVLISSFIPLQ
jgi:hypothetical protein